jgi:uncharacterized membrane protein YfcA
MILGADDLSALIELALLLIATGALSGFLAGLFGVGGAVLVPLGVKAAHAMSKRTLEVAFGLYLSIVGGRFVISFATGQ